MLNVVEDVFNAGDDIPDNLDSYKVNAIYHPPKNGNYGYYVIDFETMCKSFRIAVKRFIRACKNDPTLSKRVHDIIHSDPNNRSDINDWIEWFDTSGSKSFKPVDVGGQQVSYEINEGDGNYNSYYLSALLFEEDN